MSFLPNPERHWLRPDLPDLSFDAVASRLGKAPPHVKALPRGMANLNYDVGEGRVLRVFMQDPTRAAKEKTLLSKPWVQFKVPQVLGQGPDFLVLSFEYHEETQDNASQGRALGLALAEIHAHAYPQPGELDAELKIKQPFGEICLALYGYAEGEARRLEGELAALRDKTLALLRERREEMQAAAGPSCLLHSDYKPSNLHQAADGKPLILDWETAYAGCGLSDVGQLFRWGASKEFEEGFTLGYRQSGGRLPEDWRRLARLFDLFYLLALLKDAPPAGPREKDIVKKIKETIKSS